MKETTTEENEMHGWTVSKAHQDADARDFDLQRRILEEVRATEDGGSEIIEGVLVGAKTSPSGERVYWLDLGGKQKDNLTRSDANWILRQSAHIGPVAAIGAFDSLYA